MARGDARRDVELVEDDEPGTSGAPPPGAGPAARGPGDDAADGSHRTRRRAIVLGAAVLAVLVAVGVVGQAVVTSRERARIAALAGVPGVVDLADGPVRVLRTGVTDGIRRATVRTPDGLLVSADEGPDGAESVRAVDPADGRVAWEVELIPPGNALGILPGGEEVRTRTTCERYGPEPMIVCLADNGASVVGRGTLDQLPPTVTRLLVIDAGDGSVARDLTAAVGDPLVSRSAAVLGDLVVLAGATSTEAHVHAVAADGTVAWRATFPTTTTTAFGARVELGTTSTGVVVTTPDAVRLLDASGATLHEEPLSSGYVRGTSGDAVVVETGSSSTVVVRPAGVHEVPGRWLAPEVDDGSAPGTLLTADDAGVHAWDADGTALWTADQRVNGRATLVLDGRVVVGYATELIALDAATGEERWRTGGLLPESGLATDVRHVFALAPRRGGSGPQELVALDPSDGGVAWRVVLPSEVDALVSVLGVLVAYSFDPPEGRAGSVATVLG